MATTRSLIEFQRLVACSTNRYVLNINNFCFEKERRERMTNTERRILTEKVALEIREEMERSEALHGPFHSLHEALAILREEYLETESAIFWEARKKGDPNLIRTEAIQVAAVAVRLAMMLSPTPDERFGLSDAEMEVD